MTATASLENLRFGIFLPPIHMNHENPTLCLDRDMKVIEHLDTLGFHEAWIGEHHSGGGELIASPELMIAVLAERTRTIRLGTGVNSLPYHHPMILADRWMQLHHMTRGRAMFGCGPGSLPSDAKMMGIPVARQRDMMEESLACITKLMRGETVNYSCDWFTLENASLQMRPYNNEPVELSTASVVSPSGAIAAGRNGTSLLTINATSPAALAAADTNWKTACEIADANGHRMDRRGWRMVGFMHLAETREQARKDVEYGLRDWVDYYQTIGTLPIVPPEKMDDPIGHMIDSGTAVIGTPDDAVGMIDKLWGASGGGFGAFLACDLNWAPFEQKLKSYELFARYVMPKIRNMNAQRFAQHDWIKEQHSGFKSSQEAATQAQFSKLEKMKEELAANPS